MKKYWFIYREGTMRPISGRYTHKRDAEGIMKLVGDAWPDAKIGSYVMDRGLMTKLEPENVKLK
jgi:hypothetical protein